MPQPAARRAPRKKGTSVRITSIYIALMRGYFAALGRVAPRAAERQAAALFCYPRRLAHRDVPAVPAEASEQLVSWERSASPRGRGGWDRASCSRMGGRERARDMVPLASALVARGRERDGLRHARARPLQRANDDVAGDGGRRPCRGPSHGDAHGRRRPFVRCRRCGARAARRPRRHGGRTARAGVGAVALPAAARRSVRVFSRGIRRARPTAREASGERDPRGRRRIGCAIARARALIVHDPGDRQVPFSQAQTLANAWRGRRSIPFRDSGIGDVLYDERHDCRES